MPKAMKDLLLSRLAPFRHSYFRRFFFAQTLSLSGSWAADLARAWLILSLVGSATALGGLLVATALPGLFLILHGGVLVDRVDVRRLMIWTKGLLAAIALGLAAMVEFSQIEYWHLLVFGFLEGLVNAFDSPAFQALVSKMVPREDFQQALALSSTNFHFSRMMGPAIAGGLMYLYGPSAVFLFDGLTYVALVFILSSVKLNHVRRAGGAFSGQWSAIREGFYYIARNAKMRYRVLQLMLTIALVFPLLLVVFRTFMKVRFNLNAEEFGFLFTLPALGSMAGALSFAILKPKRPIRALLLGVPGAGAMLMLVPIMPTPLAAGLAMAFSGFFMYLTFASLTVSLQLDLEEGFRGRVSSVIGLCFVSIGPLMGLPIGALADHFGFEQAIYLLSSVFLVLSAGLAYLHRHRPLQPVPN